MLSFRTRRKKVTVASYKDDDIEAFENGKLECFKRQPNIYPLFALLLAEREVMRGHTFPNQNIIENTFLIENITAFCLGSSQASPKIMDIDDLAMIAAGLPLVLRPRPHELMQTRQAIRDLRSWW